MTALGLREPWSIHFLRCIYHQFSVQVINIYKDTILIANGSLSKRNARVNYASSISLMSKVRQEL